MVCDFLEIYLLVELCEFCDFNMFYLELGSFIEESLKGYSMDVFYFV